MESFLLTEAQLGARGGGKWNRSSSDVLPAFVAAMDFKVAPAVQAAVARLTEQQDYGYGQMTDSVTMFEAFSGWMARRHGWRPDPALMVANIDVVQGLYATIAAFSEPGDGVIAQTPVYPPFLRAVAETGRRLVENPLVDDGARFVVDVDGLEQVAAQASMILICNPHNPTGRVLERTELEAIAATATAHDLTIVSAANHPALLYPRANHIPQANAYPHR